MYAEILLVLDTSPHRITGKKSMIEHPDSRPEPVCRLDNWEQRKVVRLYCGSVVYAVLIENRTGRRRSVRDWCSWLPKIFDRARKSYRTRPRKKGIKQKMWIAPASFCTMVDIKGEVYLKGDNTVQMEILHKPRKNDVQVLHNRSSSSRKYFSSIETSSVQALNKTALAEVLLMQNGINY